MKKAANGIDEERRETILNEFTRMFIENGWEMPRDRTVKKNPYITADEVNFLRKRGELSLSRIARRAEVMVEQGNVTIKKERRRVPVDEVKDDVRRLFRRFGRTMTIRQVREEGRYSYQTYINKLGPREKWWDMLGMEDEPNEAKESGVSDDPIGHEGKRSRRVAKNQERKK